jgi:hypothetical protein
MDSGHCYKKKNWQWRIIIGSSLFLVFGKDFGQWIYYILGIDHVYSATTNIISQVGILNEFVQSKDSNSQPKLIIDVRNDTLSEYTINYKNSSGHLNFNGQTFSAGEIKRFIIKSDTHSAISNELGDIFFHSAPYSGNHNSVCQEIHTLNYNLNQANHIKLPLTVNLSSIGSKINCQEALINNTSEHRE